MLILKVIVDGNVRSLPLKGLYAARTRLCYHLPVDLEYGHHSVMTHVEWLPLDQALRKHPDLRKELSGVALDCVFLHSDVRLGGGMRLVRSEVVESLRAITQTKRDSASKPCGSCGQVCCALER